MIYETYGYVRMLNGHVDFNRHTSVNYINQGGVYGGGGGMGVKPSPIENPG